MRSLMVVLSLSLSIFAVEREFDREEALFLKLLLREAHTTSISVTKSPLLPAKEPLKVFVYAPAQSKVRADFEKWLEEWNKADGGKYGQLERATDAPRADIILARFVTPSTTRDLSDPNYSGRTEIDPSTRQPVTEPSQPVLSYGTAKIYLYVIAREPTGLKILWRGTDSARVDAEFVGRKNKDETSGKDIIKETDAKGSKDSKRPGDRLRDEFFKMMRAHSKAGGPGT